MRLRESLGIIALCAMPALGCSDELPDIADPPGQEEPTPGIITGTVTSGASPLIGVAVRVFVDDSLSEATATTGPDGAFTFIERPAGANFVEARAPGVLCDMRIVNVPAGATAEVDINCALSYNFSAGAGIYVANADGSGASWLTSGNRPDWSPDGLRIAFDRGGSIHVIDAHGSNETPLITGVDPAWSPDGLRIVFADRECPSPTCSAQDHGISVVDAAGTGATRLITADFLGWPSLGLGEAAWSPDGERIAFNHFGDGDILPAQIYVMNADGSAPHRLTPTLGIQYAESDPSWSADGSVIVFWSYGHGIATVASTGGGPGTLYHNFPFVHYGAKPDWSPDGDSIMFTAAGSDLGPIIYIVSSGGGDPRLLVPGGYDAVWSPDGARIAFVHGAPG